MKKTLLLIIFLCSIVATLSAQKIDWQERKTAANLIDDLIEDYINYAEFSDLGDDKYSEDGIKAFQDLFKDGVVIKDEANPKIAEDGKMAATEQNLSEYIADIKARYPQGISAKFTKIQADYSQLERRKARIVMERQFRAKDETGNYFLKTSDLLLEVEMDQYFENIKIVNLTTDKLPMPQKSNNEPIARSDEKTVKPGKSYTIDIATNDNDPDGDVLTYKLKNPPKFGKATVSSNGTCSYKANADAGGESDSFVYQVCDPRGACDDATVVINIEPDPVGQGLYAGLMVSAGAANANSGSINWGYNNGLGIVDDSGISGSGGTSLGIAAEVDYYFTDNIGVGTGLQYNRMSGGFDIQNFSAKYASRDYTMNIGDVEQWEYQRTATIDQLQEDYTLTNIGIPLLVKFKKGITNKINIFAHAGVLYNISSSTRSSLSNGTVDYEFAIFSQEETNENFGESTDFVESNSGNANNVLKIEKEAYLDAGHSEPTAEEHMNNLNEGGLNIGLDINAGNGDNQSTLNSHLALLGRVGAVYNISDKIGIMAGLQYTSGTLKAMDAYTLVDTIINEGNNRYGAYNSLLNGGAKYSNIGLSLGLTIKL